MRRALYAPLTILLALLPAVALGETIMNAFSDPGATATITTKGGDGTPCYFDTKHMLAAENAASIGDHYGFNDATDGHAVTLHAGERVMAISNAANWSGGAVEIRVLTGDDAGRACWVPGYLDDVVKDIRAAR